MDEGNALWYNLAQPPSLAWRLPWSVCYSSYALARRLARESIKRMIYEQNDFLYFPEREAEGQDFQLYPGELGKRIITRSPKKPGRSGSTNKPC